MIWLLLHTLPLSRQQVVSPSQSSYVSLVKLTDCRGGGEGGVGAKSYDGEKAWSSMNHSMLGDHTHLCFSKFYDTYHVKYTFKEDVDDIKPLVLPLIHLFEGEEALRGKQR
jgi:hypothetical protein